MTDEERAPNQDALNAMMTAIVDSGNAVQIERDDEGWFLVTEARAPDGTVFVMNVFGSLKTLYAVRSAVEYLRDLNRCKKATSPEEQQARHDRVLAQQRKSRNARNS